MIDELEGVLFNSFVLNFCERERYIRQNGKVVPSSLFFMLTDAGDGHEDLTWPLSSRSLSCN